MGLASWAIFQVPEPFGPDANWIKALPGYTEARESANAAFLGLYNRTKDARTGLGKHGAEFKYDLGKHLVGIGFIDEEKSAAENGMPFPVAPNSIDEVVKLGSDVRGKGTLREVREATHNFEKLKDPRPRLLRDMNWTRALIAIFWMNKNLWLMSDQMISAWYFRLHLLLRSEACAQNEVANAASRPIVRGTVTKAVSELGLRKFRTPLVKRILSWDRFVFDRDVKL